MFSLRLIGRVACVTVSTAICAAAAPPIEPATNPATEAADDGPSVLPKPDKGKEHFLSTRSTVKVSRFRFEGNTVFSYAQLLQIVRKTLADLHKPWPANSEIALDDLETCRLALSQFYVDNNFINSGAILPDQNADTGVITFRIIEGRLSDVSVNFGGKDGKSTNFHLLRKQYVIDRIKYAAGPPLNIMRLKEELEILRLDPNIKSINAELLPGASAGEGRLDLQVKENNPFQLGLQFSNRRPPSVGSTALDVLVSDSDLTGHGDLLSVRYDVLNGPIQDLRLAGAKDFSIDYTIPITPADTTLNFNFTRTDTVVLDTTFQALNIDSESDSESITLRQPLYRKPTADPSTPGHMGSPSVEFDVFITGALRDNHTTLLGQPFSFSPGDHNGTEHVTALRFGQELIVRNDRNALSARSTFSLGVPWFDSTQNAPGIADGDFFDWLGQVQYVHLIVIGKTDVQLVLRGSAQLSDRSLLTLEQFALGGVETVRGYPENDLVRDQGVAGTVEFHIPLLHKSGADIITLVPFFDGGYGWDRKHTSGVSEALAAPGLGLQFNPDRHFSAQFYYGSALINHAKGSRDVENQGLHFNILVLLF